MPHLKDSSLHVSGMSTSKFRGKNHSVIDTRGVVNGNGFLGVSSWDYGIIGEM